MLGSSCLACVAARPYLRAGITKLIEDGMPEGGTGVFGGPLYDAEMARLRREALPSVKLTSGLST